MKSYILLFTIFVIISGCNSSNLTITKSKKYLQSNTINYSTYWTAMRCARPDLVYQYKPSKDELEFSNGIAYLRDGNLKLSEKIFERLSQYSKNDTIKNNSKLILSKLYIYNSKWEKYFELLRNKSKPDKDEIKRLLYPEFIGIKTEKKFSKQIDTIPIEFYKDLITIPIMINKKKYNFIFDTGVQLTSISSNLLNDKNIKILSKHKNSLIGSTGYISDGFTGVINKLTLGNFIVNNKPCFITPSSNFTLKFLFITYLQIDGIIGWDIIKNLDVEIDYKNKKMIIRKPIKKNIKNINLFWLDDPIVQLKSKTGINLLFFLDLGAQSSCFYDFLLKKLEINNIENSLLVNFGIGGSILQNVKSIPEITFILNDVELHFINLEQRSAAKGQFFVLDGSIGNDIGLNHRLRIDAVNGLFDLY